MTHDELTWYHLREEHAVSVYQQLRGRPPSDRARACMRDALRWEAAPPTPHDAEEHTNQ